MNEMQVFQNSEFGELGVLEVNGKPYFPATECAKILGYANQRDAVNRHCKADGVVKHDVVTRTTNQHGATSIQTVEMKFISEGNLYRLITHSKLPAAERFEKWVFDEVLPSIRRTGSYSMPGAQTFAMEQITQFAAAVLAQAATQIAQTAASTSTPPPEEHSAQRKRTRRRGTLSSIERIAPGLRREVEEMLCDKRYSGQKRGRSHSLYSSYYFSSYYYSSY